VLIINQMYCTVGFNFGQPIEADLL
jgi:hypothetical protein